MSVFVGNGLAKSYGALDVFSGVQVRVEQGDRIGLVGPNGAGKTSLLCIMARVESASAGAIFVSGETRIGYLPQDPPPAGQQTLFEDLHAVFADLLQQVTELQSLEQRMTAPDLAEEEMALLMADYGHQQEEFEQAGGYQIETRIKTVLTGLGFESQLWHTPLAHLSGGQRTRALLGRLLLQEPDLLLLDEPTNHLDMRAVEWLEETLQGWKGSVVVVSHDRFFLDAVTNRTWEMNHQRLEAYRGNYSHFRRQRADRLDRWRKEFAQQQEFIRETQDFIRRYKAGQRTKEAQGRETRLQRFMAEEALPPPPEETSIRLPLTSVTRSGDLVLRTQQLVVGYGPDAPILRLPDLDARRREVVALIGPNGAGKTTLVRTLLGELPPVAGKFALGSAVHMGYLAQSHVGVGYGLMDGSRSVLDSLLDVKNLPLTQARNYLAQFLFRGDDVFQSIESLSGGQRSRIALARLTLQGANFLLLDEPTNHLDLDSQEILQDALRQFAGTILVVTHDRALVDAVATQLWIVEPGAEGEPGELTVFPGPWRQYQRSREGEVTAAAVEQAVEATDAQSHRERQREERRQRQATERQVAEAQEMEERIHRMEQRLVSLEEAMSAAGQAQEYERLHQLSVEHAALTRRLEQTMEAWANLAEAVI